MYGPRVAMWGLAVCSFVLAVQTITSMSIFLRGIFFVGTIVLFERAETYSVRRKRREEFDRQFASIDDFYQAVDKEALRRIREEQGVVVAVRELRRQYPSVSLAVAAELVKGL
jgi:hypothetical protein